MSYNTGVVFNLDSLLRGEEYSYRVVGLGGNWPATASPVSGMFSSTTKTLDLPIQISFCNTTGLCPNSDPNVLTYDVNEQNCGMNTNNLFTNVGLEITRLSDAAVSKSVPTHISIDNVIPYLNIELTGTNHLSGFNNDSAIFYTNISNLSPGTEYKYSIVSKGGNWPAQIITPQTGSFIPSSSGYSLESKLLFCSSENACPDILPGYLSFDDVACSDQSNIYRSLEVHISPMYCEGQTSISNQYNIYCDKCLNRPSCQLTSAVSSSNISSINLNHVYIYAEFDNLTIGRQYSHSFLTQNSTWPAIISPINGNFIASDSSYTSVHKFVFCESTGVCPDGTVGLIPYSIYNRDSSIQSSLAEHLISTTLQVNLTDNSCDNIIVASEPHTVTCDSCLPSKKIPIVNILRVGNDPISTTEYSSNLSTVCCTGTVPISFSVNNVYAGDAYSYYITSSNPNIVFQPSVGTTYFSVSNGGTVNAIMSTNLAQDDMGVIQVGVIHDDSSTSAIDSIAITCNSTC